MSTTQQPLIFVTGNANKLREVKQILAADPALTSAGQPPIAFDIQNQNIDIPEIQGTVHEVSREKCRRAAEIIGSACMTEDTSLSFGALNGLPGPYIKHFLGAVGLDGLNKMLEGFENKSATARCIFAYSGGPGSEPVLFEGLTEGTIVPASGPTNFGWDAIFKPNESDMTYAEMDGEKKNAISHRFRALEKLRKYLQEQHV